MDLTKSGLTEYLLKLSDLDGYTMLRPYLNRILKEADLQEIPRNEIYLISYHICKDNKNRFWNENHRREITNWLKESCIITGLFDTIWAEEEVYSIDELTEVNPDIASLNEQILLDGSKSIKVKDRLFKVYSAQLYFILTEIIKAKKVGSQEDVVLDGREYLKTYTEAYKEGEAYFESNHKAGIDTLYSKGNDYIKNLHYNFFHIPLPKLRTGWSWIKNCYPFIISHSIIKDFGFYAGLVSEVEELQEKHPAPFMNFDKCEENLPPQPIVKQKPELNGKLITFKNNETIDKIHSELKGYFPNKEAELLKALQGEQLTEILLFPHNQNKFVEVFRRLKYNGFVLNTDTETKNWICTTFQFVKKGFAEPQPFNENSVWDILNKGKGEPAKKERICITEWLPYKSISQLTREAENEKL